ncbi:MAG: hypothetical protein LBG89_01750 [Rickettsiales bacterium]|jgi:hypothetical protein|nr:hypothetical protein [Rickettsiales bacterium]
MLKKVLVFIVAFALAVPAARAEEEYYDDAPFLDDGGYDAGESGGGFAGGGGDMLEGGGFAGGGGDMLEGSVSQSAAEFDLFANLPMSFPLNANSSFADVRDFDIAGIMLGMPFESVRIQFFREAGIYTPAKKNSIVYSIPENWRDNLDYECRLQKINAPAELDNCIKTAAKKRGFLYPETMRLERPETGEKIAAHFTSNATGNVVWKVEYSNDVNSKPGDAQKFANQREKKILAFWQMILEKYGAPNSGNEFWVSSDNPADPFMRAGYGELGLVDNELKNRDNLDNYDDSRERFRAKPYSF